MGVVITWFIFGAKASQLEEENRALRDQQRSHLTASRGDEPQLRSQLVGKWATTVSKSRLGRIELIFDLGEDGGVRWQSVQQQEFTTIAEGTWQLMGESIQFEVTVIDARSDDTGQQKSALARILDVGESCLSLEVEGEEWAFHRTTT